MARKALRKQKSYQKFCRDQVVAGLINDVGGGWIRAEIGKAMHAHQVAGYRIGNSGKKRRTVKRGADVE